MDGAMQIRCPVSFQRLSAKTLPSVVEYQTPTLCLPHQFSIPSKSTFPLSICLPIPPRFPSSVQFASPDSQLSIEVGNEN
ncbi:hypothetical protein Ancab_000274 [Ancistrocladus abbreviatus]